VIAVSCVTPEAVNHGIVTNVGKMGNSFTLLVRLPGGFLKSFSVTETCFSSCKIGQYVLIEQDKNCNCLERRHRFNIKQHMGR